MKDAPIASAIVLNYNGRGFVEESVRSLLEQDLPGLEVLVVDNGSTDGSADEIERTFAGRVRILRSPRNLGFGAGNNLGIREARGRHLILLNNDAVAAPSFARELVAAAEADAAVGMVAARVLEYARRNVLDTVGHLLYPDGLNRGRGRLEEDRGQYDACRTTLFPSGAAALYGVHFLMRSLHKLKADGTQRIERAVGGEGVVYLNIPAHGAGPGKIHISFQNRLVELAATTAGERLPIGTRIVVVGIHGSDEVQVERAPEIARNSHV